MSDCTRVYYRVRFPAKAGTWGEFYSSNNGTDRWGELSKVKALITRGQPKGFKGRIREPFEGYEILEVTEHVRTEIRTVALSPKDTGGEE